MAASKIARSFLPPGPPFIMFKLVGLQILFALACMLGAWLIGGTRSAVSAGLGSTVCWLPTLACVLYLFNSRRRPGGTSAVDIFVGEAIKIALALSVLVIIRAEFPGLSWPAMITGLIVTLQANFLALLVKT